MVLAKALAEGKCEAGKCEGVGGLFRPEKVPDTFAFLSE
jgi:hypothetical protein